MGRFCGPLKLALRTVAMDKRVSSQIIVRSGGRDEDEHDVFI